MAAQRHLFVNDKNGHYLEVGTISVDSTTECAKAISYPLKFADMVHE